MTPSHACAPNQRIGDAVAAPAEIGRHAAIVRSDRRAAAIELIGTRVAFVVRERLAGVSPRRGTPVATDVTAVASILSEVYEGIAMGLRASATEVDIHRPLPRPREHRRSR